MLLDTQHQESRVLSTSVTLAAGALVTPETSNEDIVADYLASKRSDRTRKIYGAAIREFFAIAGNLPLAEIGRSELADYAAAVTGALDAGIACPASRDYSRAYLHHLVKSKEILAQVMLSWHNLAFYQTLMTSMREAIGQGRFAAFRSAFHAGLNPPADDA